MTKKPKKPGKRYDDKGNWFADIDIGGPLPDKDGLTPVRSEEVTKFVLWMMDYAKTAELPAPTWDEVVEEVTRFVAQYKGKASLGQIQAAFAQVPSEQKNRRGRPTRKWRKSAPKAE